MPTLVDLFDQALRHHQSGQLAQAENLYRQILQDQANDSRKNLQPPSEAIMRINSRPSEDDGNGDQQRDVRFLHFDFEFASSTARLIAAIMLSGFAIPLPAISNAVP